MSSIPVHDSLSRFLSSNGVLLVNGSPVTELAEKYGTPYYAYDSTIMDQTVSELRAALPAAIEIHYAMKANPMPEVVKHMATQLDGIDVASGRELTTALTCSIDPHDISFAGPGKSILELTQAIVAGIVINIESETELQRIKEIAERVQKKVNVALRINPDFELKSSGMRMSGGAKPFGIDAEKAMPFLIDIRKSKRLIFQGLHIFSGSQNLREEAICEAQTKSFALAISLCEAANVEPITLNLGGGLGIPYFPGESDLSLNQIGGNLTAIVEKSSKRYPNCKIVIELGRYLVGRSGVYVCEITDIKESRGEVFLIVNGGLHHHLSASGNFGQVIRKNYPVSIVNKLNDSDVMTASVVGPLCTPLDILADKMKFPKAEIGDLVAVFQSGAYGYTASPLGFLGHPPPAEIFCV